MIDQTEVQKEQIAELLIQIYEIHETILAESEGLPGLRDGAMLHAATARPFATFGVLNYIRPILIKQRHYFIH